MIYAEFNFSYLFLAISLGLLLGILFSKNRKVDKNKISALDKKEFMDMKRKGTLIDIRSESLYNEGKISGAKNYKGGSGAKLSQIRKDIPIFLYDSDGKHAYMAAKKYVLNGAVMVYYLKDGYNNLYK